MKKIITSITFFITSLYSQFDLYPVTDFFGGGIGYSPMYINIEDFPATDLLKDLGLDPKKFDSPFVVHGGEGFAHMTGKWRIGSYAGVGSSSISTVTNVRLFVDADGDGVLDQNEIDKDKDIAFTCGSGVTACILGLANSIISGKKPTVYDGSWSEYGLE